MLEVLTILVTFLFRERVSEALKEGIYQSMEKYGKETESNQAIDFLQAKVRPAPSQWSRLPISSDAQLKICNKFA